MTTELTKAAQQALEALQQGTAWKEGGLQKAREAIAAIERALTQRPTAQEVASVNTREQTFQNGYRIGYQAGRASLPALQQATPAQHHVSADALARMSKRLDDVDSAQPGFQYAKGWNAALRQAMDYAHQATPEPVGEPHQFPPLPEGWPARFRCDSCDGNGEIGELVSMGDFQPPERQTCPDCGGRGWTSEEPAFNAEHMREFAEAHARNTRPAPGVPEGLPAVLTDWGFDVHDDEEGRTWLTIRNPDDDVARMSVPTVWPLNGNQTISAVVLHQFSAALTSALAAAQAKGAGQ